MALSDYTSLVVDEKGDTAESSVTSPMGVKVGLYKTWLYIEDKAAWRAGGSYIKPVVMQVFAGCLCYKDIHVFAFRDYLDNICVVVYYQDDSGSYHGMMGFGVYGDRIPKPLLSRFSRELKRRNNLFFHGIHLIPNLFLKIAFPGLRAAHLSRCKINRGGGRDK